MLSFSIFILLAATLVLTFVLKKKNGQPQVGRAISRIENRHFEIPMTVPVYFEEKAGLLSSAAWSVAGLGFWLAALSALLWGARSSSIQNVLPATLVFWSFGFYFSLVALNKIFGKAILKIDHNQVNCLVKYPFSVLNHSFFSHSFNEPLSHYEGLVLRKSKDIGNTCYTLILKHRNEDLKDLPLYNSVVLRQDFDPDIKVRADFFSLHLGLPVISAGSGLKV